MLLGDKVDGITTTFLRLYPKNLGGRMSGLLYVESCWTSS